MYNHQYGVEELPLLIIITSTKTNTHYKISRKKDTLMLKAKYSTTWKKNYITA